MSCCVCVCVVQIAIAHNARDSNDLRNLERRKTGCLSIRRRSNCPRLSILTGRIVRKTVNKALFVYRTVAALHTNNNMSPTIGAVLGGALGGLAGLVLVVAVGIYCYRRLQRLQRNDETDLDEAIGLTFVTT